LQPAGDLYAWALNQAGVEKPFAGHTPAGVLVRRLILADSVMYLIVSESADIEKIAVRDKLSGGEINLSVAPGRAALVLFSRKDGNLLARFGE
jgi:hypothetical protein